MHIFLLNLVQSECMHIYTSAPNLKFNCISGSLTGKKI